MANTKCLLSALHEAKWRCKCVEERNLCSFCSFDHIAQGHFVTAIASPGVCGQCHSLPVESILLNCEVCLCKLCANRLGVHRVTRQREEVFKQLAEGHKQQAAEHGLPITPLQSLLAEKKNNIYQCFMQACDNSLEEIITETLRLESQLAESRAQVQELQEQLTGAEAGNLRVFIERFESMILENKELQKKNSDLGAEVQALKDELKALQTAKEERDNQVGMQEMPKSQLDKAVSTLQASIKEHTVEIAKITAEKIKVVLPFVSQIDSTRLDRDSSKRFLELMILYIRDYVSPGEVQEVARFFVHVIELPNRLAEVFADAALELIRKNKDEGMQLVRSFYEVYGFMKEDRELKEALIALMKLLEKGDNFVHALKILNHLRKLVGVRSLCDFAIQISAYLYEGHPVEEWEERLLSLPVDWGEQHRNAAGHCITEFLRAICDTHFSDNYLRLAYLLRPRKDPKSLFMVVEKLSGMMKQDAVTQELQKLIEQLLTLSDAIDAQQQVDAAFGILSHLLRHPNTDEVELLTDCIARIPSRDGVGALVATLVQVLEKLKSEDAVFELGSTVVRWIKLNQSVAFAQKLMEVLNADENTLSGSSAHVARLLTTLQLPHEQLSIAALLEDKVPVSVVCEFASALLRNPRLAGKRDLFIKVLHMVASSTKQLKATEWAQLTKSAIQTKESDVVRTYEVYCAFVNRGIEGAVMAKLGKYLLASHTANLACAQSFTATALDFLNRIDSKLGGLGAFIAAAVYELQQHTLLFLECAFRRIVKSPDRVDSILTQFSQLRAHPDTLRVLQSLGQGANYGYCCKLLGILVPNSEVAEAVSRLLKLANYLFQRGVEGPAVTTELRRTVQERPKDVKTLLKAISIMAKKNCPSNRIANELLQKISSHTSVALPLLCLMPKLVTDVMEAGAEQPIAEHLCTVLLEALNSTPGLLYRLSAEPRSLLLPVVISLLNTRQLSLTLKDMQDSMPVLAHVQAAGVRFFNFHSRLWDQAVPVSQPIRVSTLSFWTFLDSDRILCCGGAEAWKDAYLLTRNIPNWTSTKLQDMRIARCCHGTIYLAQFDCIFVFGGKCT